MAQTPEEITHGFTLKSPWLTSAVLRAIKPVENRSVTWKTGWYAVHTGVAKNADGWAEEHIRAAADDVEYTIVAQDVAQTSVPKGAISGVCAISHALPPGCVVDRIDGTTNVVQSPWALGPFCMVVSEIIWLSHPIPCTGQLGTWPLSPQNRSLLVAQLVHSPKVVSDAHLKYPPNCIALVDWRAELRAAKRAVKRARQLQTDNDAA